jgi:hypothetical protein
VPATVRPNYESLPLHTHLLVPHGPDACYSEAEKSLFAASIFRCGTLTDAGKLALSPV